MDVALKRPVGRPRGTTMHISERLKRYRIAERCAEYTDEYVELLGKVLRGEPIETYERGKLKYVEYPELDDRLRAGEKLMDRAFGRPAMAMTVDQTSAEMAITKIVHECRWLPPDPSDHSVVTIPEPD
jgi:hypothetical protein